ncbi:carbon monoxide dehydrogenase [Streptomyces neyagawaensis]|uniref:carbon monoxide dehydrogenase n=1 Tax=Streptomyces neyagawaensis TaxID=42238 RepID=UPI00201CEB9D|nr:carbon monoxide dehydrogenase [Streptomyces neyagawaensis]MCL6736200.1 carbon monoxide dehydrogenase [Streptomyces neyagawaensis]MDE1684160.1 carbon monoxide dehydrogenase [Streptomyces neyagawaensis]
MEHEVFVPVHVDRLREALSDPERVARAVPGLQHDAGTPPVAGRLKVRAAGHTITYRGALRVSGADDGSYVVEGDATEVRGSGTVRLVVTIRLTSAPEGTTLHFTGTATADGRITELPTDAVTATTSRLLTRFAEKLGKTTKADEDEVGGGGGGKGAKKRAAGKEKKRGGKGGPAADEADQGGRGSGSGAEAETAAEPTGGRRTAEPSEKGAAPEGADGGVAEPAPAGGRGEDLDDTGDRADAADATPAEADTGAPTDAGAEAPADADTGAPSDDGAGVDEDDDDDAGAGIGEVPPASVFEAEVPPPSLDPFAEDDFVAGGEPPAEAAHARRTMIGRSAEEVDHAPPRGRYAPVPAPETGSVGTAALRWAAPAAALAVASAVIVARALRRRR